MSFRVESNPFALKLSQALATSAGNPTAALGVQLLQQVLKSEFVGKNTGFVPGVGIPSSFPSVQDLAGKFFGNELGQMGGRGGLDRVLDDMLGSPLARDAGGFSVTPKPLSGRDVRGEIEKIKDLVESVISKIDDVVSNDDGNKTPDEASFDQKYQSAVQNFEKYFDLLDTAAGNGGKDHNIGQADLKAALNNPGLPKSLKDSIQFLLDNPAAMHQLDVAAGRGKVDGNITLNDIKAAAQALAKQGSKA